MDKITHTLFDQWLNSKKHNFEYNKFSETQPTNGPTTLGVST